MAEQSILFNMKLTKFANLSISVILTTLFLSETALATTVYIDPPSKSISETGNVSVNVSISDVQDLYGFQFDLTYNPGVLKFLDIHEGPFLGSDGNSTFWSNPNTSTPGFLDNTISTRLGMVGGLDGNGVLATLLFSPVANGTSEINLTDVILGSPDSERIPTNVNNTLFTVSLSYHRSDTNQDGCVETGELMVFIDRWKISSQDVTMPELMESIRLWKGGYGCL